MPLVIPSVGTPVSSTDTYCTLAQLRAELGYATSETADDTKLSIAINAASRQIDGYCGQRFWQDPSPVTRTFFPYDSNLLDVTIDGGDGIATMTSLALDTGDTGSYSTAVTDYLLRPTNHTTLGVPVTEIYLPGTSYLYNRSSYGRATVQVTAQFGWPAIPDDITKACLIQAAALFKAKDAVFGAVALGDTGAAMRVRPLNPMAAGLLDGSLAGVPYRRAAVG
jgi:hypothetical protein